MVTSEIDVKFPFANFDISGSPWFQRILIPRGIAPLGYDVRERRLVINETILTYKDMRLQRHETVEDAKLLYLGHLYGTCQTPTDWYL